MVEEKSIQILSKCCPKSIHYRIYSKSDNFQKMFKNVLSIGCPQIAAWVAPPPKQIFLVYFFKWLQLFIGNYDLWHVYNIAFI